MSLWSTGRDRQCKPDTPRVVGAHIVRRCAIWPSEVGDHTCNTRTQNFSVLHSASHVAQLALAAASLLHGSSASDRKPFLSQGYTLERRTQLRAARCTVDVLQAACCTVVLRPAATPMSTSLFEPRTQLNVVPVADRKQVQIFWQIDPLQQRERALLQLRVPLHGWHALLSHRLCEPCR